MRGYNDTSVTDRILNCLVSFINCSLLFIPVFTFRRLLFVVLCIVNTLPMKRTISSKQGFNLCLSLNCLLEGFIHSYWTVSFLTA